MTDKSIISNFKQISAFDFNLLFVFEAIYLYNSVTLAAGKLGSSPSSISQALNKLRVYFSDPLFVRKGQGLVPTTVAMNLHAKISNRLESLVNDVLSHAQKDASNKFVVYCSPYTAQRVMPEMCAAINRRQLPYEMTHISADAAMNAGEDILTYRKADLIFDTEPNYGHAAVSMLYMKEKIVAVCNADHPRLNSTLTRQDCLNENFTRANVNTLGIIRAQNVVNEYFHDRKYVFSSSSPEVNAAVSEQTESISFVTEWFYEKFNKSYNLKLLECEFEIMPLSIFMTYNKSSMNNPRFVAFIDMIKNDIIDRQDM